MGGSGAERFEVLGSGDDAGDEVATGVGEGDLAIADFDESLALEDLEEGAGSFFEDLGDLDDADAIDAGDLHEEPGGPGIEPGGDGGDGEGGGKPAGNEAEAGGAIGGGFLDLVVGRGGGVVHGETG
jgi:hypothetical protein